MNNQNEITKLKLVNKIKEEGNAVTFQFEKKDLNWTPGQYEVYTLPSAGDKTEDNKRYFTISSAPSERTVNITTRITDTKFKQALNNLEIGDEIERSDIDGDFIWEDDIPEEKIFVAAGIGITPFRSILVERKNTGKKLNVKLLYFNRTSEIIFQDELKELSKDHPEFQVEFIVGERVSAESILSRIPDTNNKMIYLTGPEPMVESVGEALKQKGIKIKQDWFPGYDEKNF